MSLYAKLFYAAMAIAVAFLAFTGIGTFAFGKPPMTHWVLMAHVAVAPLFAIGLTGVALTWSGGTRSSTEPDKIIPAKWCLWLILLCGLIVMLSGVVPMTPVFGTRGEHFLYLTHRYSAIVLTIAVAIQLVFFLRRPK
ncbi:MAG TPA: hypothetical protein VGO67_05835 [Verrucomicrobiae bacterium]|jgi:hypothetical protein